MEQVLSCAAEASEILALLVMLLEQCHRRYHPRHAQPGHLSPSQRHEVPGRPASMLAVSKRSATIVILAAVAVGIILGIVWHEPKGMSLPDDIRTWAGFVVVIVGAGAALGSWTCSGASWPSRRCPEGRGGAEQEA